MPILVATSASSLGELMVNVRPPVTSVTSLSKAGPSRSSGVLKSRVKQADGIDLHVGLPHHGLDFAFGVAAVVVAAVGDDSSAFLS